MKPLRLLAAAVALLALAGCQQPPPQQRLPEMSFTSKPPIQLNIGRIEVVTQYQPPLRAPNIEHQMPVSPAAAMQRWAQDRLRPLGREGSARLIVRDAKVIETRMKTDSGVTGMFKDQQAERYDATLDVVFQILDERQFMIAEAQAQASRTRGVLEGISVNERERIWYEMVQQLTDEVGTQLENSIRTYMARWLM
jgi:hypothetical protein